ncbi:YicC/YloC family endoribonuclease, partial [Verrucomicrobiota bacterium]
MALKSMTGFGEATVARKGIELTVSLSSVNRKQLDVNVRMPSPLLALEYRVQELVKEQLSRGRVNGTLSMDRSSAQGKQSVSVDMDLAQAYVGELRKAGEKLGLADGLRTDVLLRVPGLVSVEQEMGTEDVLPVLESAVKSALKKLLAMRVQEGKELTDDLRARLVTLEEWIKQIKAQSGKVTAAYREKLITRLEQAGLENLAEDDRIVKEVALFADR